MHRRLSLVHQALLQVEAGPLRQVALLAIILPIKVTANIVVVLLLLPTVAAVPVTMALAEIVKALLQTSAMLAIITGVVVSLLILQEEYFHLRRVFRYRQSSHCWKPG